MKYSALFVSSIFAICAAALTAAAVPEVKVDGVSAAKINPDFAPLLEAHPFLMQEGGAKFIRLPGGTNVLFAVGVTDRKKSSKPATEAMRQHRVAEAKAKKEIAEAIHGIHVESFVQTRETTVIQRKDDTEDVLEDLTELFEKSESDVSGMIPGLPVVGTWIQNEDDLFCLAVGRFFPPSANGK